MKKLFLCSLFFCMAVQGAESPAKRRKLFDALSHSQTTPSENFKEPKKNLLDLSEVHVEVIPDNQATQCRYCLQQCNGLDEEKNHTLADHNVIIGDVRFEGSFMRYALPANRIRRSVPAASQKLESSSSSSSSGDSSSSDSDDGIY